MIANALATQGKYRILFLSLVEQADRPFFGLDGRIRHYALGDKRLAPGPGCLKVIPKARRFLKEHRVDVIIDIDTVLDILSIPVVRGLEVKVVSWEHFNYGYEMETAKAFSLPCVSFDIPTGPGEIIEDRVNGYLVPPFDCGDMAEKLMRLMGDGALRAEFADHARDGMEKFRPESVLRDWNRLLDRLVMDDGEGRNV